MSLIKHYPNPPIVNPPAKLGGNSPISTHSNLEKGLDLKLHDSRPLPGLNLKLAEQAKLARESYAERLKPGVVTIEQNDIGYVIDGRLIRNTDELQEVIRSRLEYEAVSKELNSEFRFVCYGFEERECRSVLNGVESQIKNTIQIDLSKYDFENATFKNVDGDETVIITIPYKPQHLIDFSNAKEVTMEIKTDKKWYGRMMETLKKLFDIGGWLDNRRLDKALKDAEIPSDAIYEQFQSFYFAENGETINNIDKNTIGNDNIIQPAA